MWKISVFIVLVGAAALFLLTQTDAIRSLASRDEEAIQVINDALKEVPTKNGANAPAEVTSKAEAVPSFERPKIGGDKKVDPSVSKKSCDDGHLPGCNALASFYLARNEKSDDLERAETLMRKSCQGEEWDGCALLTHLGILYKDGKLGRPDLTKARALFGAACDIGFGRGCFSLFQSHRQAYREGIQIDENVQAAHNAAQKTCRSKYQMTGNTECQQSRLLLEADLKRPRGGLSSRVRERVLTSLERTRPQ